MEYRRQWPSLRRMDVMSTECSVSRVTVWFQLARFAVVVLLLSSVFYLVGPVLGSLRWLTNSNLPVAALMAVCPGIAALVLSRREKTFPRLMGHLGISGVRWQVWVFAVLALPVIVFGASAVTGYARFSVPSAASAALIGAVYLIGATAEEIGWTGYALPRLLRCERRIRQRPHPRRILGRLARHSVRRSRQRPIVDRRAVLLHHRAAAVARANQRGESTVRLAGRRRSRRLQPRLVAVTEWRRPLRPPGSSGC